MRALQYDPWRSLAARMAFVAGMWAAAGCTSDRPYRIGVVLDADGLRGAQLAVAEVNAAGGIHGRPLELRVMGSASSTDAGLALATADLLAHDDTVLAVIGHTNSSASLAAAQVYNAKGVVQIAPTSSTPLYTDAGAFSFRLVPSDVYQGAFLARQVVERTPRPRVALVSVNDDYGRALRRVTLDRLRAAGIAPVYDSPYAEAERFQRGSEIVLGLEHAKPDLLIWIGRAYDYLAIARALRQALPAHEVLASDAFDGPTLDLDPEHLLDGVRYVHSVNLNGPDTAMRRFRAQFEGGGKIRFTDQAVLAYDAVMLLTEAIRHEGANRRKIRDWLASVGRSAPSFRGISGPIAFPTGGDRAPTYFLDTVGRAASVGARPGRLAPAASGR